MNSRSTDVAILGAGPYGLSIALHLKTLGIPYRIFGEPMRSWLEMARGMCLKSFGFATDVYTPDHRFSFVEYCKQRGLPHFEPCGIRDFAEYGIWVQKQAVPEVEQVEVTGVESDPGGGFFVTLRNGERFHAARVVVAVGLKYFPRSPPELAGLPPSLASHTSQHHEFGAFAGKDVLVIGTGQSALEAAALLREQGARPQIVVRGPGVHFAPKLPDGRSWWKRIWEPITGLGPGKKSWLLETFPTAMYYAPEDFRVRFVRKHLGPSGAWWLRDRVVGKIPVHARCTLLSAQERAGRVVLKVHQEGQERELEADHIVAGTGFEVDVDKMSFLHGDVRARLARIQKAPRLRRNFESSVDGLYFVGPMSAFSYGPLFRFVVGAAYAAPALSKHLAQRPAVIRPDAPALRQTA